MSWRAAWSCGEDWRDGELLLLADGEGGGQHKGGPEDWERARLWSKRSLTRSPAVIGDCDVGQVQAGGDHHHVAAGWAD